MNIDERPLIPGQIGAQLSAAVADEIDTLDESNAVELGRWGAVRPGSWPRVGAAVRIERSEIAPGPDRAARRASSAPLCWATLGCSRCEAGFRLMHLNLVSE